jgi:hypothetical protein
VSFLPLCRHPACPAPAGLAIAAAAAFTPGGDLRVEYRFTGAGALSVPPPVPAAATDGLWQHTCCEAFIAAVDASEYHEINLSPSGCWAAYRFSDYRVRDATWHSKTAPSITVRQTEAILELAATVPAPLLPAGDTLLLALTVVAEDRGGSRSYWASAHAGGQPDFHHRSNLTLRLNRP